MSIQRGRAGSVQLAWDDGRCFLHVTWLPSPLGGRPQMGRVCTWTDALGVAYRGIVITGGGA